MRTLVELHEHLPYRAVVPWPFVQYNGQWDWISSVDSVEEWLAAHVGDHWTWTPWSLHQTAFCSVSFAREPDSLLFLLRFS